jgi:ATP-dependent Lon protease
VTLGLFPLNLVLFPGTRLPLHIFEPRYRALITECLERGSEFGINLREKGHLYPVGCMARVVQVTQNYPDGRMDILIEGTRRYRLLEVRDDVKPYAVGEVEPIDDEEIPVDPTLLADCADLYNQIITLVYGKDLPPINIEDIGDRSAAYMMSPKVGFSLDQKQTILEISDENARLEMMRDHLAEIVPTIRRAETVQRIVQNDGYLPAVS